MVHSQYKKEVNDEQKIPKPKLILTSYRVERLFFQGLVKKLMLLHSFSMQYSFHINLIFCWHEN